MTDDENRAEGTTENLKFQTIFSKQSKLILILSILFISLFIFYPSFLTTIGSNISNSYFLYTR